MDRNIDNNVDNNIIQTEYSELMQKSYIDYAMSVIIARALPDVRDGLKPVQRRTLYDMHELGIRYDKPYRKSARIVGDTMGKYHPHGDSSIYEALVKLAQEWNTRYPLVDGHGNFGSVDGDHAAAMRYTEARLSKISMEMLADINKNTVDFVPNFDETEKEPTVLPSRYPNLLVNGTSGIAVGMATNIPPHNLREIIGAAVKVIDNKIEENRETTIEELMEIVKGPDFPTGAQILGRRGINDAYRTGRGKIKVRGVTDIEVMPNGKSRIVITELPYMVNKALLIQKMVELVKDKRIEGITDIRDESSREGMRVVVEIRKDANANVILNQLYKHTQLQDTFGVIMLALVDNQPRILNLNEMLFYYIKHQEDVVTRRTQYDLNKAEERDHILQGLLIALDNIDEVIQIIRASRNANEAKINLMERFGLSDAQAQAIVDMKLRSLTGLEREKIENEHRELVARIAELKAILADKNKLLGVIKTELLAISDKYGDDRRTSLGQDDDDIKDEELIEKENIVVARTHLGYIKRMQDDNFKAQKRGGKGIKGMPTIEDDYIEDIFMTTTHHYIMFFTNKGRVYRLKGYDIPESSRTARGVAIVNLLEMLPGEKVTAIIPFKRYEENKYLFMATKNGMIKKTPLIDYVNVKKSGLIAIDLKDDDDLIEVKITDGKDDMFLITEGGMCIRFNERDVRSTGRSTMGVKGISLSKDDKVISLIMGSHGDHILFVTKNGMGKKTDINEFSSQNRGGKGLKCYKITEKTGNLVGAKIVNDENEMMLITNEGIIIRFDSSDVSALGRVTSGVKLMNIDYENGVFVAAITKVRDKPAEISSSDIVDEDEVETTAIEVIDDVEDTGNAWTEQDNGSVDEDKE